MEIVAVEIACYRILTLSLKMGLHWRSNPVGKVRMNLPLFKELAYEYFTNNLTEPFEDVQDHIKTR